MNVLITGFPPTKKILAIKAIRAATGLDLRSAKEVADKVEAGSATEVALQRIEDVERALDENGVTYRTVPPPVSVLEFVDLLRQFPGHVTVDDVIAVLQATKQFERPS